MSSFFSFNISLLNHSGNALIASASSLSLFISNTTSSVDNPVSLFRLSNSI